MQGTDTTSPTTASSSLLARGTATRPQRLSRADGTPTPSLPTLTKIVKGFRRGELVIFTGPTGGGKTTLLSLICGFLEPLSGSISINDKIISDLTSTNLGISH